MGGCWIKCCFSSPDAPFHAIDDSGNYGDEDGESLPRFRAFRLDQLRAATNGFSVGNIISEHGAKTPNAVYYGKLADGRRVAVKRFSKLLWLEPRQFIEEARWIGNLRSNHLANLIGCCCEGNERLLVAECMPNATLATHLREKQPMEWEMRLRIALNLAQALEYCGSHGRALYHDLNASRVLFDETGNPRLSSFGLMMNCREGESVVFSFGTVLLNLLSGTHIQPTLALNLISGKNFLVLMDSALDGHYSDQDAAELMQLVSSCLQNDARERPSLNHIVSVLSRPQMRAACWPDPCPKMSASTNSPMDETRYAKPPVKQFPLTPLGDACLRLDLTSIHEHLDQIGYMGDDGVATELSFQMWNAHLLENLDSKNHGDVAFCSKDYETAVEFYTEFILGGTTVSPTVLARRCLCYLISGMAREALGDAMQMQVVSPEWHIAYYLQAACLFMLRMDVEAQDALKHGTDLEAC